VLANPNFTKEFHVFSFASDFTIVGVLLQKNEEGLKNLFLSSAEP